MGPTSGKKILALSALAFACSVWVTASAEAQDFGMQMITRFDVDWASYGYDDAALRELVEFTLRIMLSYFLAPAGDGRTPAELKAFIRRWLGAAILGQQSAGAG